MIINCSMSMMGNTALAKHILALGYPKPDAHICKQVSIDIKDRIHIDKW